MKQSHIPVLLKEVLNYLDPKPEDFIIDGTVDGGGHATEILEKLSTSGSFLGLDWDEKILEEAKKKITTTKPRTFLLVGNYADLPEIVKRENLPKADGLLLDLGFSSWQMEVSGRGFSFNPSADNEPLLMTFDPNRKPVKEILKEIGEEKLAKILFDFSGERFAKKIAKAIKDRERRNPIEKVSELREIVESAVPKSYERGRINPATRTFQALRIYANDELGNLEKILSNLSNLIHPNGRVVIISFHSLEDGMVKRCFRELAKEGVATILTKKPVTASSEEIRENPRSRSAKLRAIKLT